jgi:hypothetical protein
VIILGVAYLSDASVNVRCSISELYEFDVDGADHLVLLGAQRTLADGRVKSVLVELVGGERYTAGMKVLEEAGFSLDMASASARGNRVFRRP